MDYATQEAELEIPNGFADVTMNRLVYERPAGDLQVIVSRGLAQGKSLHDAVAARIKDQSRALPWFEVVSRTDRQVASQAAIDLAAAYAEGDRKKYQRTASFAIEKSIVIFAVAGPLEAREELDAMFETAVASMTFRTKGGRG